MFDSSELKSIEKREDEIRLIINKLDELKRKEFYSYLEDNLKDPDTYAALNYSLILGLHHLYLGRSLRAFIDYFAMAVGVLFLFSDGLALLGLAIITGVILFELRDLFRSQLIVKKHNLSLQESFLKRIS